MPCRRGVSRGGTVFTLNHKPYRQALHFLRPKLKGGCAVSRSHTGLTLSYLGEEFTFELDDPEKAHPVERFILALDGTRGVSELTAGAGVIAPGDAEMTLRLLDESLLLTEGAAPPPGKGGLAFATELEDLYYNVWIPEDGETELVRTIFDGHAERDVIYGWCMESYHVTSRAHDCLSPILARFHGAFKRKAIHYFLDEYRHDKLIVKSLEAAGFRREDIERSLPLPYTHAVMNLLAKWANSDLLSFMGCLFVFEGTREIGDSYIESLSKYDLPEEFVKGQSIHNDINNDGDHGNISRDFYAMIDHVSADDQARVTRNLRMLYEAQLRKHDNVLRYYRAPTIGVPRLVPGARCIDPVNSAQDAA
ncbi:iron-containing redox enzyme family protein [Sorangium sp. So ce118]